MDIKSRKKGFSLTEVMLAAGILAIGFVLIATVFPAGIKLTAMATERTIGVVVANEAFAKMKLWGVVGVDELDIVTGQRIWPADPNVQCVYFEDVISNVLAVPVVDDDFCYPSILMEEDKKYCWSGILRYTGGNQAQVTVFVSRIVGLNLEYPYLDWDWPANSASWDIRDRVRPIRIGVYQAAANVLEFEEVTAEKCVNAGSVIVDDFSGDRYRVMERIPDDGTDNDLLVLERDWMGPAGDEALSLPAYIWVVPPAMTGGRYPCVGVYQDLMDL